MSKVISIVKQYNQSQRNDKVLRKLQSQYIAEGTEVVVLNEHSFIIQKCPELLYKVIELTELQGKLQLNLDNTPAILFNLTLHKLLEEELVSTNNIEHIHTDHNSVRKILSGNTLQKKYREEQIVNHYLQVVDNRVEFATPEMISKLYTNFLQDYIDKEDIDAMGELFRSDSVNVVTSTNKIIHTGVEGERAINNSLALILDYLNDDEENIFIRVAAFHYFFGYIHPFCDGNGRMVRLISAAKLYPKLGIASLAVSEVIANNQSIYYQMFEDTNSQFNVFDITSFVYQFLEFLVEATSRTNCYIEQNKEKIAKFNQLISKLDINKLMLTHLSIIYQASLLDTSRTIQQLADASGVSKPTARKSLISLEQSGYIEIDRSVKPSLININNSWLESLM